MNIECIESLKKKDEKCQCGRYFDNGMNNQTHIITFEGDVKVELCLTCFLGLFGRMNKFLNTVAVGKEEYNKMEMDAELGSYYKAQKEMY